MDKEIASKLEEMQTQIDKMKQDMASSFVYVANGRRKIYEYERVKENIPLKHEIIVMTIKDGSIIYVVGDGKKTIRQLCKERLTKER